MANLRNEFEFRSALLTALGQEHTEAEAKNEDTWRRKMLDGLGVEYNQNDVNQFGLFREKLIEGVTKKSEGGGGGGSSDFSTAEVTFVNNTVSNILSGSTALAVDEEEHSYVYGINSLADNGSYTFILYKGLNIFQCTNTDQFTVTTSGNVTYDSENGSFLITGDCTITISNKKEH